jgi:signal transduction histidine kinase
MKNTEVRIAMLFIFVLLVSFAAIVMYLFNDFAKTLNSIQIKQNTAVVGTLAKKYPQLETEIVRNYTSDYQENYEYGKNILNKYSYDENMDISLNSFTDVEVKQTLKNVRILIAIFAIVLLTGVNFCFHSIFSKIRRLSVNAESVIEGQYKPICGEREEGDLGFLTYQFNIMAERLGEYVQALSNEKLFLKKAITDISHQLKTPLASLIMFNEIMQSDHDMPEQERDKFLLESKNQLDRIEWLIKNLMKMAKLEACVVDFSIEEALISGTIQRSIVPLKLFASKKNISVRTDGDEFIRVRHDINWTTEALSNIIKNCIEHSPDDSEISVSWDENNVFVQIVIEDRGSGISKKELPKIFDRFYKGSDSCSPTNIGIGLYITKTIIERQGGSIYVSSTEGKGTRFVVRLMKMG